MKRERVKTKRGFKGFGKFILGWFVGFVSTLAILFGVGYWAYTSINLKKIEKWTKTEITDNEGLENLTLKKVVNIAQSISKGGSDSYTLAKLEEDFDLKIMGDSIFGISTSILKNSPIKDLGKAIDDTIDTATFNNVLNFMDVNQESLGLLNTVLETEKTYYVYEGKLYTDEEHNIQAEFDYTIEGDTVKFANGSHTVSSGKIKPRLSDLPLNTALNSMTDATKSLKIYEVLGYERTGEEGNYSYTDNGTSVTGIMKTLANYSVDDLSKNETFNGLYIYEVMGYEQGGTAPNYTYTKDGTAVTGTMKAIAGKTIGELSDPNTINNMKIFELMGYTRNGTDPNYTYMDGDKEVTGVMKTIANKTISGLSEDGAFNDVTIADVMGYTFEGDKVYKGTTEVTGIMASIADKTISELGEDGALDDITIADAMGYTIEGDKVYDGGAEVTGIIATLAKNNTTIGGLSTAVDDLQVWDVLGVDSTSATGVLLAFENVQVKGLKSKLDSLTLGEALGVDTANISTYPGIIQALYTNQITDLNNASTFDNIQIYQVMNYTRKGSVGNYTYWEGETEVTGIMKALAGKTIGQLDDPTTGIKSLTLSEVLELDGTETGVLKALSGKKLDDSANGLKAAINELQVWEVMGYTRSGTEGNYTYSDSEGEVTGIMKAIAGTKVNELGTRIQGLKANEVFDPETTTILKLFTPTELATLTIMDLPNSVVNKLNDENTKIGTLIDIGLIELNEGQTVSSYIRGLTILELIAYAGTIPVG